jgi:chloride channel protein, CIC family
MQGMVLMKPADLFAYLRRFIHHPYNGFHNGFSFVWSTLQRLLHQKVNETQVLLLSGLVVGIGAGLGAVVFRKLISGFTYLFFGVLRPALSIVLGSYAVILIPAIGGLIFGPIIYFFAREAKGHGVPEVMLAVAQQGGRIRPIVAAIKSVASAICIGSGGSVGREGPIVQIGSALGSTWGQLFHMSEARIRTLVACGAAGGISATFNAPIAGVFFALEIILGEFSTRSFGIVVIASVTADVIGRAVFGNVPAFPLPSYQIFHITDIPLYAILGILGGVAGVAFTRILYWFEDRFDAIKMPEYLKPVPGGLMLGALGFFLPQVFGVGYPAMSTALAGHYALGLLLLLVVAKMLAVSLTIGSGGSGGVFAPSLFIGAMLGEAYGTFLQRVFPAVVTYPGNYGLVGMAAVFAGAARAPITAIIILFELTGDYSVILPLMAAVVISTIVAEFFGKETIYTLKLRRRGIDLRTGRADDLMRRIPVSQAMTTELLVLPRTLTVASATLRLRQNHHWAVLVVDEAGTLVGLLMANDIEEAMLEEQGEETLAEIISTPPETVFADDHLDEAIRRMGVHDQRVLPVVARGNSSHPIGILSRDDILQAYSVARLSEQT